MHFEIHLTVENANIEQFKKDCALIDIKPILIETQKGEVFSKQLMTSSKYTDFDYKYKLDALRCNLIRLGYNVIRQKVEIFPEENIHPDHLYFESHIRLKLPKNMAAMPLLQKICDRHEFHLSKNLFKVDENYNYQMITYRSNSSYRYFKLRIEEMEDDLKNFDFQYDKIEIEECIFDSNIAVDSNWI